MAENNEKLQSGLNMKPPSDVVYPSLTTPLNPRDSSACFSSSPEEGREGGGNESDRLLASSATEVAGGGYSSGAGAQQTVPSNLGGLPTYVWNYSSTDAVNGERGGGVVLSPYPASGRPSLYAAHLHAPPFLASYYPVEPLTTPHPLPSPSREARQPLLVPSGVPSSSFAFASSPVPLRVFAPTTQQHLIENNRRHLPSAETDERISSPIAEAMWPTTSVSGGRAPVGRASSSSPQDSTPLAIGPGGYPASFQCCYGLMTPYCCAVFLSLIFFLKGVLLLSLDTVHNSNLVFLFAVPPNAFSADYPVPALSFFLNPYLLAPASPRFNSSNDSTERRFSDDSAFYYDTSTKASPPYDDDHHYHHPTAFSSNYSSSALPEYSDYLRDTSARISFADGGNLVSNETNFLIATANWNSSSSPLWSLFRHSGMLTTLSIVDVCNVLLAALFFFQGALFISGIRPPSRLKRFCFLIVRILYAVMYSCCLWGFAYYGALALSMYLGLFTELGFVDIQKGVALLGLGSVFSLTVYKVAVVISTIMSCYQEAAQQRDQESSELQQTILDQPPEFSLSSSSSSSSAE